MTYLAAAAVKSILVKYDTLFHISKVLGINSFQTMFFVKQRIVFNDLEKTRRKNNANMIWQIYIIFSHLKNCVIYEFIILRIL